MRYRAITRVRVLAIAAAVAAATIVGPAAPAHAELANPTITLSAGCSGAHVDIQINWLGPEKMNVFWRLKDTAADGKTPVMRLVATSPSGGNALYTFPSTGLTVLRAPGGSGTVISGTAWDWNPPIQYVNSVKVVVSNGTEPEGLKCSHARRVFNFAQHAYRQATSRIGDRYEFGDEGPSTFDCSGLVWWSFNQVSNFPGFSGNRSALQMYNWVKDMASDNASTPWRAIDAIRVSRADLQVGDLIFYNQPASWDPDPIDHVGFHAGSGNVLDAQRARGVSRHAENLGEHIVAYYRLVGVTTE